MEDNSKVSDIKNRIREFARYKKITQRDMCELLGVSYAYIGSITNSISVDKAEIFRREFPDLNIEWLLFGVGEMLRKPEVNFSSPQVLEDISTVDIKDIVWLKDTVKNLSETVRSQNEIIAKLLANVRIK